MTPPSAREIEQKARMIATCAKDQFDLENLIREALLDAEKAGMEKADGFYLCDYCHVIFVRRRKP